MKGISEGLSASKHQNSETAVLRLGAMKGKQLIVSIRLYYESQHIQKGNAFRKSSRRAVQHHGHGVVFDQSELSGTAHPEEEVTKIRGYTSGGRGDQSKASASFSLLLHKSKIFERCFLPDFVIHDLFLLSSKG